MCAAAREAHDRHLLRHHPQGAHRHDRCPRSLAPEAHHVRSPRVPCAPRRTRAADAVPVGDRQCFRPRSGRSVGCRARFATALPGGGRQCVARRGEGGGERDGGPSGRRHGRAEKSRPAAACAPSHLQRAAGACAMLGVCSLCRRAAEMNRPVCAPRPLFSQLHGQHVYDGVRVHRPTRLPLEGAC